MRRQGGAAADWSCACSCAPSRWTRCRRAGRPREARARHRRYFADLVRQASEGFDQGGAPGELAAPLLADHANLRAALEDAMEVGDEDGAVDLALGLRPVWLAGMLRQESQELVDRLHAAVRARRARTRSRCCGRWRSWTTRPAPRAGTAGWRRGREEIGDREALAMATGNLFGQALNARDRDEMRRLRPGLLALITPETSDRALGWTHYFLALDAYVDGRLQRRLRARVAERGEGTGDRPRVHARQRRRHAAARPVGTRRRDRARRRWPRRWS